MTVIEGSGRTPSDNTDKPGKSPDCPGLSVDLTNPTNSRLISPTTRDCENRDVKQILGNCTIEGLNKSVETTNLPPADNKRVTEKEKVPETAKPEGDRLASGTKTPTASDPLTERIDRILADYQPVPETRPAPRSKLERERYQYLERQRERFRTSSSVNPPDYERLSRLENAWNSESNPEKRAEIRSLGTQLHQSLVEQTNEKYKHTTQELLDQALNGQVPKDKYQAKQLDWYSKLNRLYYMEHIDPKQRDATLSLSSTVMRDRAVNGTMIDEADIRRLEQISKSETSKPSDVLKTLERQRDLAHDLHCQAFGDPFTRVYRTKEEQEPVARRIKELDAAAINGLSSLKENPSLTAEEKQQFGRDCMRYAELMRIRGDSSASGQLRDLATSFGPVPAEPKPTAHKQHGQKGR